MSFIKLWKISRHHFIKNCLSSLFCTFFSLECMRQTTHRNKSLHFIFFISSHPTPQHKNTKCLATNPETDFRPEYFSFSLPSPISVCIHHSRFHLVFSCLPLGPWGFLLLSYKLSYAIKTVFVRIYRRLLGDFQWKYLQVIQFVTFQETEVKAFNLQ